MFLSKLRMSPVIGLLVAVLAINILIPTISLADGESVPPEETRAYAVASAHKTSGVIVSMGDSYSAGEGIQPFYGSRTSTDWALQDWLAHRSQDAYGGQLVLPGAGRMSDSKYPEYDDPHWYFVAASGATTWDINGKQKKEYKNYNLDQCTVNLDPQIDIFDKTRRRNIVPDYITLTLGGNDLGFVDILIQAAINDMYLDPCLLLVKLARAHYKLFNSYPRENGEGNDPSVRDRLKEVFKDIDKAASIGDDHPVILVAGYPHLLNADLLKTNATFGDVLNALTVFTPSDAQVVNAAIDLYNNELYNIVQECQSEGIFIEYVDVSDFEGHEVNTKDPWINGLTFNKIPLSIDNILSNQELSFSPISGASLHPNLSGANCYAECFQRKINELEGLEETPQLEVTANATHIGSEVTLGNYAGEDIEWIVLDEDDSELLLISKYILEHESYNFEYGDTTWEECSLRTWLNEDFYNSAFDPEEREIIVQSTVVNCDSTTYNIEGGNDTQDHLFLLSIDEANMYFNNNEERASELTTHAAVNHFFATDLTCGSWWLRSPGQESGLAAYVYDDGSIVDAGAPVFQPNADVYGVRPVMRVRKDSVVFVDASVEPDTDEALWSRSGNHIIFGSYEQDGDLSNGPEPIEWEVISEEDGRMLLISLHVLDCQPYNTEPASVTWETCSLRSWLNNDFLNTAFSEAEQNSILTTTLSNPDNTYYGTAGGSNTDDKVFCLSFNDLLEYYDSESIIQASDIYSHCYYSPWFLREATPYAIQQGVMHIVLEEDNAYRNSIFYSYYDNDTLGMDGAWWWLRSPGSANNSACFVYTDGSVSMALDYAVEQSNIGVRPAVWLSTTGAEDDASTQTGNDQSNVQGSDGDYVVFGRYEQDNDLGNGPEPIEWEILAEEDGRLLLISRYVLDCQKFHNDQTEITWETSDLRSWLNESFLKAAFSSEEQQMINLSTLANPTVPGQTDPNVTQDKVFCLSIDEVMQYYEFDYGFEDDDDLYDAGYSHQLITAPTAYAIAQRVRYETISPDCELYDFWNLRYDEYGIDVIGMVGAWWWLRTVPVEYEVNTVCDVMIPGHAGWGQGNNQCGPHGVRPAIWVDASAVQSD